MNQAGEALVGTIKEKVLVFFGIIIIFTVDALAINDMGNVFHQAKSSSIALNRGMSFNCVRPDSLAEILMLWYRMFPSFSEVVDTLEVRVFRWDS